MFGLLDPKPVRRLLEDHQSGRQDNHKLLFSLVMVEQWLRGIRSNQERFADVGLIQSIDSVRQATLKN
jgi:hypothetical protein